MQSLERLLANHRAALTRADRSSYDAAPLPSSRGYIPDLLEESRHQQNYDGPFERATIAQEGVSTAWEFRRERNGEDSVDSWEIRAHEAPRRAGSAGFVPWRTIPLDMGD